MNRPLQFFILLVCLEGGVSFAQDAQSELKDVPPPKPPLVNEAPAKSAWVVEVKPTGKKSAGSSSDSKSATKSLKRQYWIKSGSTMQCLNEWSDGTKTQDWVVDGVKLSQGQQGDGIHLRSSKLDARYHDFAINDFEMLGWITPEAYVRAVNYRGEPCYLFEAKTLAPSGEGAEAWRDMKTAADFRAPTSPTTALINIETRLPVVIVNGDGQFHFQFRPAPSGTLKIPEPYASLWKAYAGRR